MNRLFKMKMALGALVLLLFSFTTGSVQVRSYGLDAASAPGPGRVVFASQKETIKPLSAYMDQEIAKGNLRIASTQVESRGGFVHTRYEAYYKGLKVWGAQLLRHSRGGTVYLIEGDLHKGISLDVKPTVRADQAVQMAKTGLLDPAYKLQGKAQLMIYPGQGKYDLIYQINYAKFDSQIISFINAKTGQLVFRYENVKNSTAIGLGTGTLQDQKKMSTDFADNTYYADDLMRPAEIITADSRHSTSDTVAYYITDDDNVWTSDGTVVDGHAYLGWTYDYYYLIHGRKGMDDKNRQLVLVVHLGTNYENAYFNPSTKWLYFGDGNPSTNYPFTTALDIVAHEFTHGVTDATSNLTYLNESGALNEAFSDIMAVSCEFFQQPEGVGYMKAEWWQGEDIEKHFGPGRSLADPSSVRIFSNANYRYPDHYSRRYILPPTPEGDYGGVHINSTIPSHWYYLLAHGGTNKTSGISVTGVGLSKAEKIAYRGWVYYMRPSTTFAGARSATNQAAIDLYGAGSTEALRVRQAWTAVGVN